VAVARARRARRGGGPRALAPAPARPRVTLQLATHTMEGTQPPSAAVAAVPLWAALVAGSVGGLLNAVVGHPFDTLKVRAQAQQQAPAATCGAAAGGSTGSGDNSSLFAGLLSPVVGATPFWAVFYFGYRLGRALQPDSSWLSILRAGAITGSLSSVVYCPVQCVKCLAQAEHISSAAALRRLTEGGRHPLGVFRGFTATLLYSIPAQAAFYCVYELALARLPPWIGGGGGVGSMLRALMAGGLGGVAEFSVGMPMDCVKTRVQTAARRGRDGGEGGEGAGGALATAQLLWRAHGWRGFYRGYWWAILRAFPANGAAMLGVELTNWVMRQLWLWL
jgi:solute carrier family 25 carnitine/acylcarnitine transporter 20/29